MIHGYAQSAHPIDTPSHDDIPFKDSTVLENGSGSSQSFRRDARQSRVRPSTLTASEKAIFDRILKEQDQKETKMETETVEEIQSEGLEAPSAKADDPYEDLNNIFDAAIREVRNREEQQARNIEISLEWNSRIPFQRALDDLWMKEHPDNMPHGPRYFRKGFARPLQFIEGTLSQPPIGDAEESDERLRIACDEHRDLIQNMLDRTSTDGEIWKILETEVFSMVKQLQLQMEHERKLTKATKRAKAKASRQTSRLKPPTEASQQAFAALISSESKALAINTLLAILQTNYAHYNLYAMRHLRRRHPSTPYSLQILPYIKSLGSISYVLGASTGLYNEVLFVTWNKFSDLHGIADLLQEMINQGIEANNVTLRLLQFIDRTRTRDLKGRRGEVLKQWWTLRGVRDDWYRVRKIYEQLKKEVREQTFETISQIPQDTVYTQAEEKRLNIYKVNYDKKERKTNSNEEWKTEEGGRIRLVRTALS